jgi:hypothetical protein
MEQTARELNTGSWAREKCFGLRHRQILRQVGSGAADVEATSVVARD